MNSIYTLVLLTVSVSAAVDLGSCAKPPTMAFGTGFAGSANAQEFRFKPENEDVFTGQSTALDGNIIARFLCDRVRDTCKAPQETQDICTQAQADFTNNFDKSTRGTAAGQSAADLWNAAFDDSAAGADVAAGADDGADDGADVAAEDAAADAVDAAEGDAAEVVEGDAAEVVEDAGDVAEGDAADATADNAGNATGGPVDTSNCAKDRKDSKTAGAAFAVFDNLPCGPINITGPCTQDAECGSSCCDGKKCRAPDALKGAETCRNGLSPDFSNGLKFVNKGASGNTAAPANNQENKGRRNGNGQTGQNNTNAAAGSAGGAVDTSNCAKDRKDSKTAGAAFAAFDNLPCGPINITGPCTQDAECGSSCCDGKKCRAPDALKGTETCRNGLAPDFTNGLKFVTKPVV